MRKREEGEEGKDTNQDRRAAKQEQREGKIRSQREAGQPDKTLRKKEEDKEGTEKNEARRAAEQMQREGETRSQREGDQPDRPCGHKKRARKVQARTRKGEQSSRPA